MTLVIDDRYKGNDIIAAMEAVPASRRQFLAASSALIRASRPLSPPMGTGAQARGIHVDVDLGCDLNL
jgi:hypothetical protein